MNTNIQKDIPKDFNDNSKVWIYQSNRKFLQTEVPEIQIMLNQFTSNWKSHGDVVKGFGKIFYNYFIVLMADETQSGVSGCSTDSSVHLIKEIEQKLNIDLFNRQNLAFNINDNIELIPLSQINKAVENNIINPSTIYFNNTILTKKDFLQNWTAPISQSWLSKKIKFSNSETITN